jgi:hypothetical protein
MRKPTPSLRRFETPRERAHHGLGVEPDLALDVRP